MKKNETEEVNKKSLVGLLDVKCWIFGNETEEVNKKSLDAYDNLIINFQNENNNELSTKFQ